MELNLDEMLEVGVYDYLGYHWSELSKYDLCEIAREMIWQLEQTKGDYQEASKRAVEALRENN